MNKEEAKARIEAAQSAIADAEKELAAAKAALALSEQEPASGRTVMKPSEVPVGEYFRYVSDEYNQGRISLKTQENAHVSIGGKTISINSRIHDDEPVYLTDPYGNAIEPCEELPGSFAIVNAVLALAMRPSSLSTAFIWDETKEGAAYWHEQNHSDAISPSAAAKLRGMIHKWNQENGGQG